MCLLILGGCHVSGYKVAPWASFADLLAASLCVRFEKRSPVALKHHALIRDAIRPEEVDTVVLQLGNYEFHASLKRLFRHKLRQSGPAPETGTTGPAAVALPKESPVQRLFRRLLVPFTLSYLLAQNTPHLARIRSYIICNPGIRFIILTPIPCLTWADNLTRRAAGKYVAFLFGSIRNVVFIDLYNPENIFPETCYADSSHLNEAGHAKLSERIRAALEAGPVADFHSGAVIAGQ